MARMSITSSVDAIMSYMVGGWSHGAYPGYDGRRVVVFKIVLLWHLSCVKEIKHSLAQEKKAATSE
jgi:hypothetical protein